MSLFAKGPAPDPHSQPSDSHLRDAATERLAELSEYCAWERRRSAGRYDWAEDIARNLRKIQSIAPKYAAQAGDSPQADEHLRSIMTDSAVAIAKLKLRKEYDDRIDTTIVQRSQSRRRGANSGGTSTDAALLGTQAANLI